MENNPSVAFPGTSVRLNVVSVHTGEPVVSLEENGRYEYELNQAGYSLRKVAGIISRSRISQDNERGLIEPGNYVGRLKLQLLDQAGVHVAETHIDVRSTKLQYDSEYRSMLEDIAGFIRKLRRMPSGKLCRRMKPSIASDRRPKSMFCMAG